MAERMTSEGGSQETPVEGHPREASALEEEVRLVDYLYPLYRRRGLILLCLLVTAGATALFTFRAPKIYEARAVLMPETSGGEDVGLRATLAQQFGVAVPGQKADPSTIFTNVLKSRPFAERVAERLNLVELLVRAGRSSGVTSVVDLQQAVAERLLADVDVKVDARRGSAITITVPGEDPILAAHLANTYVTELDRYNREANITKSKRLRLFLEERLRQANRELTQVQQTLRTFQEQHKAISISEQAKQTLATLTKLEAQKLDLEIQREAQERFVRESHSQVKALQAQLAALQKNIEQLKYAEVMARAAERDGPLEYYVPLDQVPLLSFQESRLLLEVGTKSKVVELLTTQVEQAKLDEARELPTLTVLEPAVPPQRPSKPKVKQNILLGMVVGLFGGVMVAFMATYFEREAQDTMNGSKWQEMRLGLRRDLRRVVRLGKA
ncbi:MAG: hypothetical protein HYZ81_20520 [Nitrospinae bacterium]|nr:hypothetical protein [Nitrospinota bacterium]